MLSPRENPEKRDGILTLAYIRDSVVLKSTINDNNNNSANNSNHGSRYKSSTMVGQFNPQNLTNSYAIIGNAFNTLQNESAAVAHEFGLLANAPPVAVRDDSTTTTTNHQHAHASQQQYLSTDR